jgi:hypothetical protein
MCDSSRTQTKLTDKEVIDLFVKYLAEQDNPGLKVDDWPDEKNRNSTEIDAVAGPFAIEHTSIDTVPNQRRDADWFLKVVKALEDEFKCKMPFRLVLTFPYDGIQTGQDWDDISDVLRDWILFEAPKLPFGRYIINKDKIPFEIFATKRKSARHGLLFCRFAPDDKSLPERMRKQLDRKLKKLIPHKERDKTTILLVESDDIAFMDESIMWDELRLAYPKGMPDGLDQIWFADTSIVEDILFINLSRALGR